MGTDYAMVSAMGVFYVLPSIILYSRTQKSVSYTHLDVYKRQEPCP